MGGGGAWSELEWLSRGLWGEHRPSSRAPTSPPPQPSIAPHCPLLCPLPGTPNPPAVFPPPVRGPPSSPFSPRWGQLVGLQEQREGTQMPGPPSPPLGGGSPQLDPPCVRRSPGRGCTDPSSLCGGTPPRQALRGKSRADGASAHPSASGATAWAPRSLRAGRGGARQGRRWASGARRVRGDQSLPTVPSATCGRARFLPGHHVATAGHPTSLSLSILLKTPRS